MMDAEGSSPPPATPDLPTPIAESLASIWLGTATDRDERLQALSAAHPLYVPAIERMVAELRDVDLMLAQSFPDAQPSRPERIGRYRVLSTLGEGAFGTVYLCAEDEPVRREVAVKLLRPGVGDRQTLARFANERQLLAELDHPAIARVLDAGAAEDGRPFFVMDRIDGVAITAFADLHGLTIPARIELFVDVCRGVQHAHSRGIVHRDLKPANILVTHVDGRAAPRIIDFGIAKVLAATAARPQSATETGRVVGTPGYMSPEQRQGAQGGIDARSDVFALGVVLYELLVGERPFSDGDTSTDREPPRPSTHRDRLGKSSNGASTKKGSTKHTRPHHRSLRHLRGDLDWIVVKAMQGERERRYEDAGQLADDLVRHLAGEPIRAGRPSTTVRAARALRRHRMLVSWAFAVIAIGGGIVVSEYFRRVAHDGERINVEQTLALAQRLVVRATTSTMEPGDDRLVLELLREAADLRARVASEYRERPDLQVQQVRTLRDVTAAHFQLGQFREGVDVAQQALQLAQPLVDKDPSPAHLFQLANVQRDLGRCSFMAGDFDAARQFSGQAVTSFERLRATTPVTYDKPLAKTMVEYASAVGAGGDASRQLDLQLRALNVLHVFAEAEPDDDEAQRDLVRLRCGLARMQMRRGDLDAAGASLELAASLVARFNHVTDEERALVAFRMAGLRSEQQRTHDAIAAALDAAKYTRGLLDRRPHRYQDRNNLLRMRSLLFDLYEHLGEHEEADAQAALLVADAAMRSDAIDAQFLRIVLSISHTIVTANTMQRFAQPIEWLGQAIERVELAAAKDQALAATCVEARLVRAHLRAGLGQPDPTTELQQLVQAATFSGDSSQIALARWLLVLRQLDDQDHEAAAASLAALTAGNNQGLDGYELLMLRLRVAAVRRDEAALTAAIEAACDLPDQVRGMHAALFGAVWLTELTASGAIATEGVTQAVTKAIARGEAFFLAHALPPGESATSSFACSWSQAAVLFAELVPAPRASALRDLALPLLDRLRGRVGAIGWDETGWVRAHRRASERK